MDKVIIQDTEKDILQLLTIALNFEGFTTLSLETSDKILAKIDEFRPHVVILDYKMEGSDCIQACKTIKVRYPHLPVVAISCNININTVYSLHGFDDYVAKPFDLDQLYSILRKHIPNEASNVNNDRGGEVGINCQTPLADPQLPE